MKLIISILLLTISFQAEAISNWYKEKYRGWFWYEDRIKDDEDKELFSKPKTPQEAVKQIAKIKKEMDEALSYAVLTQDQDHIACTADCVKATANMPIDSLTWCVGCLGSIYPFSGNVAGHIGGIQASSLLATRAIAKEHRLGMALETSTSTSEWYNGPLCRKHFLPIIKKTQYKLQLVYPTSITKGPFSCVPLGMSDVLYNSLKEFPFGGEDFGYLLWRKKNCCFL